MLEKVERGKKYRNIKKGSIYYVHMLGVHSETQEKMVVYSTLDTVHKPLWSPSETIQVISSEIWIRPLELFKERFEEVQ